MTSVLKFCAWGYVATSIIWAPLALAAPDADREQVALGIHDRQMTLAAFCMAAAAAYREREPR